MTVRFEALNFTFDENHSYYMLAKDLDLNIRRQELIEVSPTVREVILTFTEAQNVRSTPQKNTLYFYTCVGDYCEEEIEGAEQKIEITLTGGTREATSIAVGQNNYSATAIKATEDYPNSIEIPIQFEGGTTGNFHFDIEQTGDGSYIRLETRYYQPPKLTIQFGSNSSVPIGEYQSTFNVTACYDHYCEEQLSGSPFTIDVNYDVRLLPEGEEWSVSLAQTTFTASGNRTDGSQPNKVELPLTFTGPTPGEVNQHIYIKTEHTDGDTYSYMYADTWSDPPSLEISFNSPLNTPIGSHRESYEVKACYDYNCDYQLTGSPLTIEGTYNVTRLPAGVEEVSPTERTLLPFSIIDSDYRSELNAIAIASDSPRNSVYVVSLDDNSINELPLVKAPTSITFASGEHTDLIVIGHDALVSVIPYSQSNPSASLVGTYDIPIEVFDIAATLEAAYAVPARDQWTNLYRLDFFDGEISKSGYPSVYAGSRVKMHPDEQAVYLADSGLSPSDIEKIDISVEPPSGTTDSPYHGDYAMCGDLWISENGQRIYTACGNTFKSSTVSSQDMTYTGKLPLMQSGSYSYSHRIMSMSEASGHNEIGVIEKSMDYDCRYGTSNCPSYLSFFTKDYYNTISRAAFDQMEVAGGHYHEEAQFVFYNNDGSSAFVITTLKDIPTPTSYLVEIER